MKFQKQTFLYWTKVILFIAIGLLLKIIPAKLVTHFELPVFFDCLGTILAAMMGGNLPAVIVGFFANVINGMSDSVTLYYGGISILIASVSFIFFQKKFFLSIPKILIVILCRAAL